MVIPPWVDAVVDQINRHRLLQKADPSSSVLPNDAHPSSVADDTAAVSDDAQKSLTIDLDTMINDLEVTSVTLVCCHDTVMFE